MKIKELVGSGDKIGRLILPFLITGLALNVLYPYAFSAGGPPAWLRTLSLIVLAPGLINWIWSVYLILTRVPKHELITEGPFALVKHPLYTGVGLLVLPWAGFLLNTWFGALLGVVLYAGSRMFSAEEESKLSETFGPAWDEYCSAVIIPWL